MRGLTAAEAAAVIFRLALLGGAELAVATGAAIAGAAWVELFKFKGRAR